MKCSLVSVKVEPRSTSRLISALFILPLLFYVRDKNVRALTFRSQKCVIGNQPLFSPRDNLCFKQVHREKVVIR